jgi:hypothetical protein
MYRKNVEACIEDQNQCHMPLSMLLVRAKACFVYKDLLKDGDDVKPFSTSSGWFWNFTRRRSFCNIKLKQEAASADTVAAEEFAKELLHIIEKGYSPKEIFNIDETATTSTASFLEPSRPAFHVSVHKLFIVPL